MNDLSFLFQAIAEALNVRILVFGPEEAVYFAVFDAGDLLFRLDLPEINPLGREDIIDVAFRILLRGRLDPKIVIIVENERARKCREHPFLAHLAFVPSVLDQRALPPKGECDLAVLAVCI